MVVFEQNWLYSDNGVVFGQRVCIRAKEVVFEGVDVIGQKWLYSGNSCCIWAKMVVFGQNCCTCANVVEFGQKRL